MGNHVASVLTQPLTYDHRFLYLHRAPWQITTKEVVGALLLLGQKFPELRHDVNASILVYLRSCEELTKEEPQAQGGHRYAGHIRSTHIHLVFATSVLGFLGAAAEHCICWTSEEQFDILSALSKLITEESIVAIEAAFSAVRNQSGQHPSSTSALFEQASEALSQPGGALIIKREYARLVETFAALTVLPSIDIRSDDILQCLMRRKSNSTGHSPDTALCELLADVAVQGFAGLDEGSDYLQIGTVWQQERAQEVKGSYFTTYLCCVIADDEIADQELLLSWLESTLTESDRIAQDNIDCIVLRCLACLAKESEQTAANLTRSLPRMLIHRKLARNVGQTAAQCLLYVLKLLSTDAVITTIWGLGNSLSGDGRKEVSMNGGLSNGHRSDGSGFGDANGSVTIGSTVSLIEETRACSIHNQTIIIDAIVTIARGFGDPKITALAISLLIQKITKVNRVVDLAIITGSAELGVASAITEFKTLLRFYRRLISEGIEQEQEAILHAVSRIVNWEELC